LSSIAIDYIFEVIVLP